MNGRTLLTLAFALGAAAPVRAQGTSTKAAERLANEWLAAFNTGDSSRIARFEGEHYDAAALGGRPLAASVTLDRWKYMNFGPATIVKMEQASDTAAVVLVHNADIDSWGHLTVRVSPASGKITRLSLTRHEERPAVAPALPKLSDAQILAALDTFARRLTSEGKFSGAIGLVHDGRTVGTRAYGLANRDSARVNSLDTRFELASVGKLFTGAVIAKLVERGTLSYDDTLGRWIPDYPNAVARRTVTVRHLLTHSSGIADFFMNPEWDALTAEQKGALSLADHFRFFAGDSLQFVPGSRSAYRNSGYLLLGLIAERATHTPYAKLYRQLVLDPAGMSSTWTPAAPQQRATKYTYFGPMRVLNVSQLRVAADELPVGSPAGGGIATVNDMTRFAEGLLDGKVLSRAALDGMLARHGIDETPTSWQGYGFDSVEQLRNSRVANKSGYTYGAHSQFDIYPDIGYALVVLSNVDTWGAEAITMKLRALLSAK